MEKDINKILNELKERYSDVGEDINKILNEFNEHLHSGNYTREECYKWLESQSAMHPEIPQFAFLYPEQISFKSSMYIR